MKANLYLFGLILVLASSLGFFANEYFKQRESIDRLRDFVCDNLIVQCASYENSLRRHNDETFIYADPPYLLEKSTLYGERGSTHKDFDHLRFAEEIKKKNNWSRYQEKTDIIDMYNNGIKPKEIMKLTHPP